MRNKKELLIILRDWMLVNFERRNISGICQSIFFIVFHDQLISVNEYKKLREILNKSYPHKDYTGFCWKIRLLKPRIEFINKLIESYE